jgi:hypothetical protein
MVIHYFDAMGVVFDPLETDAPLVIYADAVLAVPRSAQFLESIGGGRSKVVNDLRIVQHPELSQRRPLDIDGQPSGKMTHKDLLGVFVLEAPYHMRSI